MNAQAAIASRPDERGPGKSICSSEAVRSLTDAHGIGAG